MMQCGGGEECLCEQDGGNEDGEPRPGGAFLVPLHVFVPAPALQLLLLMSERATRRRKASSKAGHR
jgi:hypothetical protein